MFPIQRLWLTNQVIEEQMNNPGKDNSYTFKL